jgi:serralysin
MAINPTVYEQYLLELVNWARANPSEQAAKLGISLNASLSSGTISTASKQPLVFDEALIAAARSHSDWMLQNDVFSHTGVSGSNAGARMDAAGYDFQPPYSWGENIAWNGSTGSIDLAASVLLNHDGLFRSAGHRVNLMNNSYKEIGLGVLTGVFTSQGTDFNAAMVTQNFAASGTGSYLTGVVINDADGDRFYDIGEAVGGATITATGATGTFQTTSWAAGGYRLELPPGDYAVTVNAGELQYATEVRIGTENVKLDVFTNTLSAGRDGVADQPAPPAGDNGDFIGTGGLDIVSLSGSVTDYVVVAAPDGSIQVANADGAGRTLREVERLQFDDGTLAFDLDGAAGQAYRVYQAAFDRTPDIPGLAFWIEAMDAGTSLASVSAGFVASAEFAAIYGGAPSDGDFVARLYENVLGRAGEAAGLDYWQGRLAEGTSKAEVLAGFSESAENVAGVAPAIADGIWYA